MYTSSGGILGDLDGDGFVSTSDLLAFLSGFDTGTTITPNIIKVTRDAFDPDQDFGSDTEEDVTFTTSNLDSQEDTAAFSISVTNSTGVIQVSDGAGDGSFGGILLNAFNNKKMVIVGSSTVEVDTSAGLKTRLEVSVGAYNSSNQLITAVTNPYEELNVLSGSTFYEAAMDPGTALGINYAKEISLPSGPFQNSSNLAYYLISFNLIDHNGNITSFSINDMTITILTS